MVGTIVFLLIGIVLLVVGGVLLYFRRRTQRKAAVMQQTETSGAGEASGLSPGTLVEVKGTLRCGDPLESEMAKERCAYYRATITREYLREDHDDDDVGSNRRSEILSQNELFAPFSVEDDSGSVPVNAEGAEVDARQVVSRFERDLDSGFSIGGFQVRIGEGERTLGYRYTESILPVDAPVYVLGAAQEDGSIGAPQPGGEGQRFVVSYRSEEALSGSLGKEALWLGLIAVGLFVLGAIFVAVGVASALGYIQFQ